MSKLKYKRVLLKISGEGFCGAGGFGLASDKLEMIAAQIKELQDLHAETAVVVGAGNFVRGTTLCQQGCVHRVTGDQMGMLATVINGIALQDALETQGLRTRVISAVGITAVCEPFIRRRAVRHLEKGRVIVLVGGTGNPFFTTDTCAALRASEIQADVLIKATKVDGVYSADPVKEADAKKYDKLSYDEVLQQNLEIMDRSAVSLCQDNKIDIIVCNLMAEGTVSRVARGEHLGTLITAGK